MNTEAVTTTGKPSSNGALAAALSAVGSVLAALTCCLPVLPFVLAAGTASSARFISSYIGALRPYRKPSVLSQVVLWLSALIVAISILLPQAFADLVERLL